MGRKGVSKRKRAQVKVKPVATSISTKDMPAGLSLGIFTTTVPSGVKTGIFAGHFCRPG